MTEIEKSWAVFQESLNKLYEELFAYKIKLQKANEEIARLKEIINLKDDKIRNLETQEKIIKIADNLAEDTRKKTELKLKINEYIREIDRCIAFLSSGDS